MGSLGNPWNTAGVELPVPDYGKLEEVINQVLEEMGCQKVKHSVAKCISIYETRMHVENSIGNLFQESVSLKFGCLLLLFCCFA